MAGVKVNFSVDSSQVNKGINDLKKGVNDIKGNSAGAAQAMDQFGDATDGAVRALDSVGGACGMASTGFSGIAGDLIYLAKNPVALAIAAIGALIAGIVALHGALTQNSEDYLANVQAQIVAFQGKKERMQKAMQAQKRLFERLKVLGEEQALTNKQRIQAAKIIDILCGKYEDLGVSINGVTGKITGLAKAQKKLIQKQAAKKSRQFWEQKDLIDKEIVAAMTADIPGQVMTSVASYMQAGGLTTVSDSIDDGIREAGAGYQFGKVRLLTLSSSQKAYIHGLLKRWNSGDTKERIAVITQMLKNEAVTNDKDVSNGFKNLLAVLNKRAKVEQQHSLLIQQTQAALNKIDAERQAAAVKAVQERQEKITSKLEDDIKKLQAEKSKIEAQTDKINKQMNDKKNKDAYDSLKTNKERIKYIQKEIEAEKKLQEEKRKDLEEKTEKSYGLYADRYKLENELETEKNTNKKYILEQRQLLVKKQIAKLQIQIAKLKKEDAAHTQQLIEKNEKLAKLKQEQAAAQLKMTQQRTGTFLDIESSIIDQVNAEKQRFTPKTKAQILQQKEAEYHWKLADAIGMQNITDDDLKKIRQLVKQYQKLYDLRNENDFKQSVIDDSKTLKDNFFSKFGDGSNLVTAAQKIVQAQLKLGRSLTQTEKDQLLKVEQLEKAMADLGSLGLDKIIGIQTNALTSRGGWAGGVRNMASQLQINKRIADYSGKQVTLLQQIKKVVQNAGRI